MQEKQNDNLLYKEKALADALFGNIALADFDTKQKNAPEGYFESFENNIVNKAKQSQFGAKILSITEFGKVAIAASLLTIAAISYLFIQNNQNKNLVAINVNLQDIPTAEIDNYVNANELIAEIDWQEALNSENSSFEQLNSQLIKDSNNNQ